SGVRWAPIRGRAVRVTTVCSVWGRRMTDSSALPSPGDSRRPPRVINTVLAEALVDPKERERLDLTTAQDEPFPVIVELNLRYEQGLQKAAGDFKTLCDDVGGMPKPVRIDVSYFRCKMSVDQAVSLASREQDLPFAKRTIYRIWPDFPIHPLIDR